MEWDGSMLPPAARRASSAKLGASRRIAPFLLLQVLPIFEKIGTVFLFARHEFATKARARRAAAAAAPGWGWHLKLLATRHDWVQCSLMHWVDVLLPPPALITPCRSRPSRLCLASSTRSTQLWQRAKR